MKYAFCFAVKAVVQIDTEDFVQGGPQAYAVLN